MKYKTALVMRIRCPRYSWGILSIALMLFLSVASCSSANNNILLSSQDNYYGKIQIMEIDFASSSAIFTISITPTKVSYDMPYDIVLLSNDNYYYDSCITEWSSSDFVTPPPNERNINIINADQTASYRQVTLTASLDDKDIEPIFLAYKNLYNKRYNEALNNGGVGMNLNLTSSGFAVNLGKYSITQSDYQNLCKNYIKIEVISANQLEKILNNFPNVPEPSSSAISQPPSTGGVRTTVTTATEGLSTSEGTTVKCG